MGLNALHVPHSQMENVEVMELFRILIFVMKLNGFRQMLLSALSARLIFNNNVEEIHLIVTAPRTILDIYPTLKYPSAIHALWQIYQFVGRKKFKKVTLKQDGYFMNLHLVFNVVPLIKIPNAAYATLHV